ncbi:hypothetical protein ACEYYA_02620 [Paracoccus sp. p3-h83]|uniref:hypothetical protein n=1 Tax=Paracoccus sp. p3-h83 TaxID=3342805 RepID=UPI0035B7CB64
MSLTATVYLASTGVYRRTITAPDIQNVELNVFDGEVYVEGHFSESTYFHDGGVADLPPSPGSWATWDGSAWIDARTDEQKNSDLLAAKQQAIAQINEASAAVRRRYVTDIPGQEALYLMKEAEARGYLGTTGAQITDYPLIGAEVGITGTTPDQVAQIYLNLANVYRAAAAQLETARLGSIAQIELATTEDAASAVVVAFQALLETSG